MRRMLFFALPRCTPTEPLIAGKRFDAATHAPVLTFQNPLSPKADVVLNNRFHERDYLNNANRMPRLPDYAFVDLSVLPDSRWPGKIALAGFFDERWRAQERSR